MISFKQFVTEVYRPVPKNSVKWKRDTEISSTNIKTAEHTLPSGKKLTLQFDNRGDLQHHFGYTVGGHFGKQGDLSPDDHSAMLHHVVNGFNHYAQHVLPKGEHILGIAFGYNRNEVRSKDNLYGKAMESFASKNPKFRYEKQDIGINDHAGNVHILHKL